MKSSDIFQGIVCIKLLLERVSNTAERFGLQAFPSICKDALPAFISARVRWRLSAKKRFRDESRCLKANPPLRSKVDASKGGVMSNENSMRIIVATGNEFRVIFKTLLKRNSENRIVVFQQGSLTADCFDG